MYTSLNVCLVSKRYRKGIISPESKLSIVHFHMSFRPTCCSQGYSSIQRGKWQNYQMICNISLKLEWTICAMLCRGVIM